MIALALMAAADMVLAAQVSPPRTAVRRLLISVDANPKTSSDHRGKARERAVELLRSTRATHFHYSEVWSKLETQPGVFDLSEVKKALDISESLPVGFTLKIVEAGVRQMPESYKALPWDAPEMVQRISRLIDEVAPVLQNRAWYYSVGNEIDLYFAQHPGEIAAYARMLGQIRPLVRSRHPSASFTTTLQFSSVPQLRSTYAAILSHVDHIGLTYYPLNPDFTVRPPGQFVGELARALEAAGSLPIAFQEIGYPSSTLLGSSPEQQAEFMRIAFDAMRAVGTGRVLGATYLFQSDLPQWLVNDLVKAYGVSSDKFRAFLTTLGLRDERDRPKPGWNEFVRQTEIVRPRISSHANATPDIPLIGW